MNKRVLDKDVQDFIRNNTDDVSQLVFRKSPFRDITMQEIVQQLESRLKVEKKIPEWFESDKVYYPPKLNIEQSSSAISAKYKSTLVSGDTLADLTGGFGVDSYYFSSTFKKVYYYEKNSELAEITTNNFIALGKENIVCSFNDGLEATKRDFFNCIYVDPSRRHQSKGKVFFLSDCTPDMTSNLDKILNRCDIVMIKTSPMLDIKLGLKELPNAFEIHVLAIKNEVKELIWLIKKNYNQEPLIKTINFKANNRESFDYLYGVEKSVSYSEPLEYLYEPNAAIMKSGGFDQLVKHYNVDKLHKHSHLFTSPIVIDFPGRKFKILKQVPYNKKNMRAKINFEHANITVRNFPETVNEIRKRWKLKEGGHRYLFFTTLWNNKKMMLLCEKIK